MDTFTGVVDVFTQKLYVLNVFECFYISTF